MFVEALDDVMHAHSDDELELLKGILRRMLVNARTETYS